MKKLSYILLGAIIMLAGTVYAVQISVPSANGSGMLLQSLTNGTYAPASLIAGSNVTISTTTSTITISSTGGSGSPAGSSGNVQFNDSGSFGGSNNLFWNKINNRLGIGSTSPFSTLSIASTTYNYVNPLLTIATSTDPYGVLFTVNATSTVETTNQLQEDVGVRVGIGTNDYYGYGGLQEHLTVNGKINSTWMQTICQSVQLPALSADGHFTACPSLYFAEDNQAVTANGVSNGIGWNRVNAQLNDDGAGVFATGAFNGSLTFASSTPTFEVNYRIRNTISTTSQYYVGFTNVGISGSLFENAPSNGCYFTASSTQANWIAVCRITGASNITMINTGVASTSVTGGTEGNAYQFRRMKIIADDTSARFFIQIDNTANFVKVAEISTNYPTNTLLNAGMYFGNVTGNSDSGFDFFNIKFWFKDMLPAL
jgi:hypothetical protein